MMLFTWCDLRVTHTFVRYNMNGFHTYSVWLQLQCKYIANCIQTHPIMWTISQKCMYKTAVACRANRTMCTDLNTVETPVGTRYVYGMLTGMLTALWLQLVWFTAETMYTCTTSHVPNYSCYSLQQRILSADELWYCTVPGLKYKLKTVNSKSFVGKVLLRIKWKFELTVHFKHEMLGKW